MESSQWEKWNHLFGLNVLFLTAPHYQVTLWYVIHETRWWLWQTKYICRHLLYRYSVTVNQVMVASKAPPSGTDDRSPIHCLSFFDLRLPLLTNALSVLLWFTAAAYPFGIFNRKKYTNIVHACTIQSVRYSTVTFIQYFKRLSN
jgi:hypothetical protein